MIRASMIGKLMTSPDKASLPVGAITALDEMVSQKLLNWRNEQDFFTLQKGIQCENESIELYNEFKDEFYIKNVERITKNTATGLIIDHDTGLVFDRSQPLLTGECDILDIDKSLVIDIKTAYNKKSHPLNLTASKLYEWQLRAYMYLYNVNHAELAYCLVDTPIELRKKSEPDSWHEVSDVPMHLRVRTFRIERCLIKEKQMLDRVELSMKYFNEQLELLG